MTYFPSSFAAACKEQTDNNIYNACYEMFAECIADKETWRIILETPQKDEQGDEIYYMIDFSACGEPFDDNTKVMITDSIGVECKNYDTYREANDWLMDFLTDCMWSRCYVECF